MGEGDAGEEDGVGDSGYVSEGGGRKEVGWSCCEIRCDGFVCSVFSAFCFLIFLNFRKRLLLCSNILRSLSLRTHGPHEVTKDA